MDNRKGLTLTELIVVIILIPVIVLVVIALNSRPYKIHPRLWCGTNLKGMANAMNVYAFDYRDEYPIAGAQGAGQWAASTDNWNDPKIEDRDNLTVAASLFMLVREADVGVKSFVCSMSDETPFVNDTGFDIVELWDFGPNPTDHQSYSYQFPYGQFPADGTSNPENAIMADRSPWFDEKLTVSSIETETADTYLDKVSLIDFLDANKWKQRIGNAQPHGREGQNVLFNDGHVEFAKRPDVGTRDDNIYTIAGFSTGDEAEVNRRKGIAPTAEVLDSRHSEDSLLVNDRKKKSTESEGK